MSDPHAIFAGILNAKRMIEELPPSPFFASSRLFPNSAAISFKNEGREYVLAHPDFWAWVPAQTNELISNPLFAQSARMGALPQLRAATAPDVRGGQYYGPSRLFESRGYPAEVQPSWRARDEETAARLWDVSEELTGVAYSF